jgi:hypothetical protein
MDGSSGGGGASPNRSHAPHPCPPDERRREALTQRAMIAGAPRAPAGACTVPAQPCRHGYLHRDPRSARCSTTRRRRRQWTHPGRPPPSAPTRCGPWISGQFKPVTVATLSDRHRSLQPVFVGLSRSAPVASEGTSRLPRSSDGRVTDDPQRQWAPLASTGIHGLPARTSGEVLGIVPTILPSARK